MSHQVSCSLVIKFEDKEICRIDRGGVEEHKAARIESDHPRLVATDSAGNSHSYDLSSVKSNGASWLHFSLRVSPNFAAQFDCLLGENMMLPAQAFAQGEALGIRFEPFLLPESDQTNDQFKGRGLFFRGFHFSGTVTPGNVSLICICDACRESFRIQSFHAGFSNIVYFYCDQCPNVLIVPDRTDGAPVLMRKPEPRALKDFEQRLPACDQCGGAYAYRNPFRCPHCKSPYIDFERYPDQRDLEYYGNVEYGKKPQFLK